MLDKLVFVGFRSRVVALDRDNGRVVWRWESKKGKGYVTVLLDGDRLIASVMGYTYCLEAATGRELWFNELAGMGVGVASLASLRGGMAGLIAQAAALEEEQRESASAAG